MKIIDWLESIEERFDRGINRDETVVFTFHRRIAALISLDSSIFSLHKKEMR